MIQRSFAELVTDLRMRRTVGDKPPILLLGAGASVDAGIGAMPQLYKFFGCADFDAFVKYIETTTAAERYRYLAEFLQTQRPADITPGYQALATLCAQNYFDLVLTTNMDPLLDDALAAARLWRRDYLLIVNGMVRPERLSPLLSAQSPRVKIVKLHGDLFQRFMAWTPPEMDSFLTDVAPYLTPAVTNRDFLVVGYSLRDQRVRQLVESSGGSVWFTHPQKVPDHLLDSTTIRAVIGPNCAFEAFFPSLAGELQLEVATTKIEGARVELPGADAAVAGAQTMDDVMAATLSVAGPGGIASSTAFLLSKPRVIVCDRYASEGYIRNGTLEIIAPGNHRLRAKVIRADAHHAFGPILLEAPPELRAVGLRFDSTALAKDEPVQVVVAAGEKTGISTGRVEQPRLAPLAIQPIKEKVRDLAQIECVVAPGASGAPVIDDTMAVRGFIVAGSSNPDEPRSMAYPLSRWAALLKDAPRTRAVRKRANRTPAKMK